MTVRSKFARRLFIHDTPNPGSTMPDPIEAGLFPDSITAYDFELPKELIAQEPLPRRDDARLLVVHRAEKRFALLHVRDLPEIIRSGDLLVLNDTRVLPAQLSGYRDRSRGRWDGLFLEADENGIWKLLAKTRGKIEPGETVTLQDRAGVPRFKLKLLARLAGGAWAARPDLEGTAFELLDRVGRVPLPHYIRGGQMNDADPKNYQTIFANKPGSVAAPTAGLHFTKSLIDRLIDAGVGLTRITLHVGLGTFRPISVPQLSAHQMHSEWGQIDSRAIEEIEKCKARGGRVLAVGTTSLRLLETVAHSGGMRPWQGQTELFIRPPFEFRVAEGLLTNFHLPKSSLLVLVRTFGGDALIQQAYELAIRERFRFFSYGDAMLIL